MMRTIYLKMMRKRMRDTCLLGKVFVPNIEYLSKHPLLYLTFILCLNVISIEESDDDVQSDITEEDTASNPEVPNPYKKVYSNMPRETHMLKPVPDCHHCSAKRFPKEPPRFCCRSGKVELNAPVIPDQLMRLWMSSDVDARHFRNNIRFLMATSLSFPSIVASTVLLLTSETAAYIPFVHMA
jgi:hypothetical protein